MKIALVVITVLLLSVVTALAVAASRWRADTSALVAQLTDGAVTAPPQHFAAAQLDSLPPPVARYLRAVLRESQPVVRWARVSWRGEFLMRPEPDGWRPFTADQQFAPRPGGFVWDARIRMAPGVTVRVRDAFVDGAGSMRASIFGLWQVIAVEGTPEIASGALQRYLGEAIWFPTALLPSQGVTWTALDDSTARAALTLGGTTVSLDFHFGPDSLVTRAYAAARFRDVNGRGVPTPWQARVFGYEARDGMRIPAGGEVEWLLPEGPLPYWRGQVADILYTYADSR